MTGLVYKFIVSDEYSTRTKNELSLTFFLFFVLVMTHSFSESQMEIISDHSCCQGNQVENTSQT